MGEGLKFVTLDGGLKTGHSNRNLTKKGLILSHFYKNIFAFFVKMTQNQTFFG